MNDQSFPAESVPPDRDAFKVVRFYLLVGGLWIIFSDQLALALTRDPTTLSMLSLAKGLGYIVITALLLYGLLQRRNTGLREGEARYRSLFQNNHSVMLLIDPASGDIVDANPAACAFYGYTHPELTHLNITAINQLTPDQVFAEMEQAQQEQRRQFFFRHRLATGDVREVEVYSGPIRVQDRALLYSLVHDITERKRVEEALRQSQDNFARAFNSSPAALAITQLVDGKFLSLNEAYTRIMGYHPDEILGRTVAELNIYVNPDQRDQLIQQLREQGVVRNYELLVRTQSGEVRSLLVSMEPALYDNEKSIISTFLDMTERKQVEVALRESEARYRLIADNTDDVIWLLSLTTGKFTYVSPSVQKLRGYTPEEVLAQTIADALTPESLAWVTENLPGRFEAYYAGDPNAQVQIDEVDQPCKDGSIVQTEVVTTLLADGQGQVTEILGVTRNITARKQAEAELHRMMEELKRSNADLEQFAYVASHDLQEPLRAVASTVQLLQRRYGGQLNERADEFIRHAVEGATRMQTLINDLLVFSRVGTRGQPFQPVDSADVLADAVANLTVAIGESGAVITSDNLPTVVADRTQLIQLFQNLIANAIKFRGERVPQIQIRAERQASEWVFAVADNGIGLEAQYYERIFGVFQRLHTRREYLGTGIGLALCKKIIERHGGHIWVESEPGHGSTFYFTLPERPNSHPSSGVSED